MVKSMDLKTGNNPYYYWKLYSKYGRDTPSVCWVRAKPRRKGKERKEILREKKELTWSIEILFKT